MNDMGTSLYQISNLSCIKQNKKQNKKKDNQYSRMNNIIILITGDLKNKAKVMSYLGLPHTCLCRPTQK